LILAAHLIDIDAPAGDHGDSVLRLEPQIAGRGAEAYAAQLGVLLLEGEVVVSASGKARAGDFARDPDVGELAAEQAVNRGVQLGDAVGFSGGFKREGNLFHWLNAFG